MSLIDKKEFLRQVVRPALDVLGLRDGGADILVLGTALTESGGLKYIRQVEGPALGLFQAEPATHMDLWVNWLRFARQEELRNKLVSIAGDRVSLGVVPEVNAMSLAQGKLRNLILDLREDDLARSFRYGAAICRLSYFRRPEPLPNPRRPVALAAYWKKCYNTVAGKGTIEKAEPWFREAIRIGIELDTEEGLAP